jgi:hypothetical protein
MMLLYSHEATKDRVTAKRKFPTVEDAAKVIPCE